MSEIIERAAKALWDEIHPIGTSWDDWAAYAARGDTEFDGRDTCRKQVRAILQAIREPSETMIEAAFNAREHGMNMGEAAQATWQAMIDQALAE